MNELLLSDLSLMDLKTTLDNYVTMQFQTKMHHDENFTCKVLEQREIIEKDMFKLQQEMESKIIAIYNHTTPYDFEDNPMALGNIVYDLTAMALKLSKLNNLLNQYQAIYSFDDARKEINHNMFVHHHRKTKY